MSPEEEGQFGRDEIEREREKRYFYESSESYKGRLCSSLHTYAHVCASMFEQVVWIRINEPSMCKCVGAKAAGWPHLDILSLQPPRLNKGLALEW